MEARKLEQRGRRRLMARNVSEVGSALSLAPPPRRARAPRRASTRLHALPLPSAPRARTQPIRLYVQRKYTAPEQLLLGSRRLDDAC